MLCPHTQSKGVFPLQKLTANRILLPVIGSKCSVHSLTTMILCYSVCCGWVDSLWTRRSGMPPTDIQTATEVTNIIHSFITQPENHVILPNPQIKCQPAVKILSMNHGTFTWRTPSHGVGNTNDTFAEICSVDAFVLVPPNSVLISLVYSYTYFVVVRYANFPPAESNKHVRTIIYSIHDFTMNKKNWSKKCSSSLSHTYTKCLPIWVIQKSDQRPARCSHYQ